MEPSVQIAIVVCSTIIALAGMFVLLAWVGSKKK